MFKLVELIVDIFTTDQEPDTTVTEDLTPEEEPFQDLYTCIYDILSTTGQSFTGRELAEEIENNSKYRNYFDAKSKRHGADNTVTQQIAGEISCNVNTNVPRYNLIKVDKSSRTQLYYV